MNQNSKTVAQTQEQEDTVNISPKELGLESNVNDGNEDVSQKAAMDDDQNEILNIGQETNGGKDDKVSNGLLLLHLRIPLKHQIVLAKHFSKLMMAS